MAISKKRFGFQGLLASLLLLILLPGFLGPNYADIIPILFALLMIACLYLVATEKKYLTIGLVLAVPALITHWSFGLLPETARLTINSVLQIAFLSYVCGHIYTYLFTARKIVSDVIFAALCLYFLLGIVWTFAYFLIEINSPGAISLVSELGSAATNPRDLLRDILYFSFVTITTLGYGDITPVSRLAQSLAIIQAFVGQIYIAIVIARLVAMQLAAELRN